MNLFIFGAGYTANQFIRSYRNRFTRVSGTFRSPGKAASLQAAGIIPYAFDGVSYDARILDELARTDALLLSIPPHTGSDLVLKQFGHEIAFTRHLSWVGYLSTVGVYGNANGEWVDENSPPCPLNERSRDRLATELQWLDLGHRAHCAVQIFRLAGIYGPGRNALLRVMEGTARRIIKPGQIFNRIHTCDIAQVLMASIERPCRNMIYNVADDEPGPPQDVITYAAELLGRDPPPSVPFNEADLGPMAHSFYRDNKRVRNTRIKEKLGVTLRYPNYRLGLDALLTSGEGVRAPLRNVNVPWAE